MIFLLSLAIITTICPTVSAESELLQVFTVFRHGARAPVENFSSDESKAYFFRGAGQLTDQGVEQAKLVGQIMRERYINTGFLDSRMLPTEVYFRSSPVPRCLMTIEKVASSMYPDATPAILTADGKDNDFLCWPRMDCDFLLEEYRKEFNLNDSEVLGAKKRIWEISGRALIRAALNTTHLKDKPFNLIPALLLEKEVGLAVPAWFDDEAYEEAETVFYNALAVMSGVGPYYSEDSIKVKSGLLLHTILSQINRTVECHPNCGPIPKFLAFSTHDILVLSLLEALGIREVALGVDRAPEFCAAVIIELWKINGEMKVKVLYRKKPSERDLVILSGNVRNCESGSSEFCNWDRFTSCCDNFITLDPKGMCYAKPSGEWNVNTLSIVLFALCVCCLVAISILMVFVLRYKTGRTLNFKC